MQHCGGRYPLRCELTREFFPKTEANEKILLGQINKLVEGVLIYDIDQNIAELHQLYRL